MNRCPAANLIPIDFQSQEPLRPLRRKFIIAQVVWMSAIRPSETIVRPERWKRTVKNRRTAIVLWLLMGSAVWLTANQLLDYPVRLPREYSVSAESGGVVIGVQPIRDPAEQKTYLRMTLKDLVPVFVVIQNESKSDTFIFDKTRIKSGQAEADLTSPDITNSEGRHLAGALISPLFITHDYKNQQNLLKREIQSTTLSPGASTHGFLYLPEEKDARGQKMRLRVVLVKAGSGETSFVDLSF